MAQLPMRHERLIRPTGTVLFVGLISALSVASGNKLTGEPQTGKAVAQQAVFLLQVRNIIH